MGFPGISQKLKQLILNARRDHRLMHLFARVFAEYVVDAILRLGVELPFGLPKSGIIVDAGSGYLTELSGGLVKYALQNEDLVLYLVDSGFGPSLIISETLRLLGLPKNIVFVNKNIESFPLHNVDMATLLFSLHEMSRKLYWAELMRSFGIVRLSSEMLSRELPILKRVLSSIYRILKEGGKVIVVDKEFDDYDAEFVRRIVGEVFSAIRTERIGESRFVEAKK